MSTLNPVFEKYPESGSDALIPILQDVQEQEGFLSKSAVYEIARYLNIPASKIYGVATFYNQFRFEPIGKYHILVCRGTACHVKGSSKILETLIHELSVNPGKCTPDGLFSLEVVACIGACGLAPVISVNGEFHAGVTPDSIRKILDQYRKEATHES